MPNLTQPETTRGAADRGTSADMFVSIGECMVELSSDATPGTLRMGFAGDTFNTAWYMRALSPQTKTRFVTRVGSDAVSQSMLDVMTEAGIDISHVAREDDRSVGLYMISLDKGERSFSYWRDTSAARRLAQDRATLDLALAGGDVLYFSGITFAILDGAGRDTLLAALTAARAKGQKVAFDSNLRPRLWASLEEMTRETMRAAAISDIVLPSYDDESVYFGDADPEATVARYADAGATTIVVKNGAGAVRYLHDGAVGQVATVTGTTIRDTTAAGDSFNAGFFASLAGGDVETAIRRASAVAGQVIGGHGALVPLDLDRL
jgi:2-dehydro-3-deoxygluconokinase